MITKLCLYIYYGYLLNNEKNTIEVLIFHGIFSTIGSDDREKITRFTSTRQISLYLAILLWISYIITCN